MSSIGTRSRRPDEEEASDPRVGINPFVAVLGLLAVLGALAMVVDPDLATAVSVDYLIVMATGGLLLVLAAGRWWNRLTTTVETARPPAVEERSTVRVPGTEFDRLLGGEDTESTNRMGRRMRIRDRLRSVARDLLADRLDESPTAVENRLEEGTWTDDEHARAMFDDTTRAPLRSRVSSMVSGPTLYQRRARSVIAELARLVDGASVTWNDASATESRPRTEVGQWRTERWRGLTALSLTLVGVGVVWRRPTLVLGGGVLVGLGAFVVAGSAPDPDLSIERTVRPTEPRPGATVRVHVEVENVGDSLAPDVRIVDGVPAGVTVESGTPRHGTALRPGASSSFEYAIEAVRGDYEFDPVYVVSRNLPGTVERVAEVEAAGDDTLVYDVSSALELSVPLRKQASQHVGRVTTDVGGSGIEFHSVREYRTGDPLTRIDWNRAAREGELATLQFREERSATVMLVVDAREKAYLAPSAGAPSALDRSVLAAAQLAAALLDSDDRVGLAALSPKRCWLAPGGGHTHLARIHEMLASHDAFAPSPPKMAYNSRIGLAAFRKRFPSDAQLLVFSPIADDAVVETLRQLEASGYPVTVVSPDTTAENTPGQTLAGLERRLRLSELRRSNVRVVDWEGAEPLALALTQAGRRWSR